MGVSLALALVTFLLFSRAVDYGFIDYDDDSYVANNPHVQSGLKLDNVVWAFTTGYGGMWQPLTWCTYLIDAEVGGPAPRAYRLTNIALHVANALLLFAALASMTSSLWRSAFVAALFALHPLRVQSVVWIAERKDVLSVFFWMLTLVAYYRYAGRGRVRDYVLVVLTFVLGLLSKPMLVSLPFVLLLLDFWPLGRLGGERGERWTRLVLEKIPLVALAAASAVVTVVVQHASGALGLTFDLPLSARLGNAVVAPVSYLGKMLWPVNLSVFYPHPGDELSPGAVAASGALVLAVTALAIRLARHRPYLAVGWFWYLISLAPVSGVIQTGAHGTADRFTYVPLVGVFIMIAWGAGSLVPLRTARARAMLVVPAAGILIALAAICWRQIGYWRDSETLFRRGLEVTRKNDVLLYNLGVVLAGRGRLDEAAERFSEALRIQPGNVLARYNLGLARQLQGRKDEAVRHYLEAIRYDPRFPKPRNAYGAILLDQGMTRKALEQFEAAVESDAEDPATHYNLGNAYMADGRYAEAVRHYRRTLDLMPGVGGTHVKLAMALFAKGDAAGAWREVRRGRQLGAAPPEEFLRRLRERSREPAD